MNNGQIHHTIEKSGVKNEWHEYHYKRWLQCLGSSIQSLMIAHRKAGNDEHLKKKMNGHRYCPKKGLYPLTNSDWHHFNVSSRRRDATHCASVQSLCICAFGLSPHIAYTIFLKTFLSKLGNNCIIYSRQMACPLRVQVKGKPFQ